LKKADNLVEEKEEFREEINSGKLRILIDLFSNPNKRVIKKLKQSIIVTK
jgi:hypothetical protein